MNQSKVELAPFRDRAWLIGSPGSFTVDVPSALVAPWQLPLDVIATVEWFSSTQAVFRTRFAEVMDAGRAPFMVRYSGHAPFAPDLRLIFRLPLVVPFRNNSVFPWRYPIVAPVMATGGPAATIATLWQQTRLIRRGLASSLEFRVRDREELLPLLDCVGVKLPTFGDPS